MKFNEYELGQINIVIIDGDRGKNYPHQDELLDEGDCVFLSANNVTPSGFKFDSVVYITKEKDIILRNGKLNRNDIVITTRGTVGNVGLFDDSVPFSDIRINSGMLIVRCGDGIDSRYLYYVLRGTKFQQQLIQIRTGTAQPQLPKSHFQRMKVELPPLETQQKIAQVLEAIDRKIKINEAINENLFQLVSAFYTSKIGTIVQPQASIGNYSEQIYSGGTPSTSQHEYWGGALHWFSSGETRNRFVITTEKTITQEGVDNSSTKLAHKYDIVMASAGQGFTRGQTSMLLLDTYVNQSVIVIHADRLHLPYLFWNLTNRYEELRAISDSSSIRGSLTTKMISGFEVAGVTNQALQSFSDFAWPVIFEIEKNLLENERLTKLRDELLPKLMSGELDVSALDL